jgi:hypothetical protein
MMDFSADFPIIEILEFFFVTSGQLGTAGARNQLHVLSQYNLVIIN